MYTTTEEGDFTRNSIPSMLLRAGALAGLGMAAWLASTVSQVLPSRDPVLIPFWSKVAFGFAVYGAAGLWLGARPRVKGLRWGLGVLSPFVIYFGALSIAVMWRRAGTGRGFEGYLVILAAWMVAQGAAVLLHLFATRRRRVLNAPATG